MHHILVVDDDEEITALLTQYLTRFGYATYAACDGDSMRAQLAAQPIDLVVLDVMLPGVESGWPRSCARTRSCPSSC